MQGRENDFQISGAFLGPHLYLFTIIFSHEFQLALTIPLIMGRLYYLSLISSHLYPTPLYKKSEIKKQNYFIEVRTEVHKTE